MSEKFPFSEHKRLNTETEVDNNLTYDENDVPELMGLSDEENEVEENDGDYGIDSD